MVGIVNVPTTNTNDGADVLVTIGAPVNQSYNATVSGGVAVVSIDDEDLQNANDVTVAMFLTDGTQTDDATLLIDISGVVAYEVLDVAAAVAGFEVREYVNSDATDTSGALVTSITPNEQYVIRALWQDTDGVYAGDSVGDLQFMDVTLGSESFVGRDGATNYNLYLYTAPSTNATVQDATFTYGKYTDSTLSTLLLVSVPVEVSVLVSTGLSTASLQAVDLGSSDIALGSVDSTDIDTFMSPLVRQYGLTGTSEAGVSVVAGKRALTCRLSIVGAYNDRPTNRIDTGYALPPSLTYRVATSVYIPINFDGGGTKSGLPFGTGKIGFGLYSANDVSGGTIDPSGFSMRFIYDVDPATDDIIPSIYDYAADRVQTYGDRHPLPNALIRGQWNDLYMEITSNSNSSLSDGRIRAWQDSDTSPVLDVTGKQMISSGSDTRISRCKIEVFMGGQGVADYTPASDQDISFADNFIGVGTW